MPYIKTPSRIRWHYLSKGKGNTALLLIHGWAGDANIWYQQLNYFSGKFKTIALDLPGHGKSDWKNIDFDSLINDIIFICNKLELKNLVILGLSFGGQIAIRLALQPGVARKLILIDTTPKFIRDDAFKRGISIRRIRKLDKQLDTDYPNILAIFVRSLFTEEERQKDIFSKVWELFSQRKVFPQPRALRKMLNMIEEIDLRDELDKIKIPTLIICGQKDPICPPFIARYLNKYIKNSKLEIISGCGHMPFLTETEKFNRIVDEFLSN